MYLSIRNLLSTSVLALALLQSCVCLDTCQHQDYLPDYTNKGDYQRTPIKYSDPNSPRTMWAQQSFLSKDHQRRVTAEYNKDNHNLELQDKWIDNWDGQLTKIFIQVVWHRPGKAPKSQVYMFQEGHHCSIHVPWDIATPKFTIQAVHSKWVKW